MQLLHYCSAALCVDLEGAALDPAADAAAGSDAGSGAAPAQTSDSGSCDPAAEEQPSMRAASQPDQVGGAQQEVPLPPALQLGCETLQQPPQASREPQQEWHSVWQPALTIALEVRLHFICPVNLPCENLPQNVQGVSLRLCALIPEHVSTTVRQPHPIKPKPSRHMECCFVHRRCRCCAWACREAVLAPSPRPQELRLPPPPPTLLAYRRCWPMRQPCSEAQPPSGASRLVQSSACLMLSV